MGRKARAKKKESPVKQEAPAPKESAEAQKSPAAREAKKERREASRVGTDLVAYFRVVSGEGGKKSKEVSASLENLSKAGCRLATNLIMVDGLHILSSSTGTAGNALEIRIPLKGERNVQIQGTTLWYNTADARSSHRYKVGVQVTQISEEDLVAMRNYLGLSFRDKLKNLGARWMNRLRGSREG
ncbi:MAG: PilZ domain-containing protein [bacterium]|nr:PilZ domain-containing protein [bacterium]